MSDPYDVAVRHYQRLREEEAELRYVPQRKVDAVTNNFVLPADSTSAGLHRVHVLEQQLESAFSTKRYYFDRRIHEAIVTSMLPVLIGDDWPTLGPVIMNQRRIKRITKLVACMGPRRMGKSMAIAKCMAAIAFVMLLLGGIAPGKTYTQSVFSTNLRTSNGIRQYLLQFYAELGIDVYIIKDTDKQCILCTDPTNRLAARLVVNFLPSGSTTYVSVSFISFWLYVFFFDEWTVT